MTPRFWMVRYICAITRVPAGVEDVHDCKSFFEDTRQCLTRRYAQFPWFKELGTYSVILVPSNLFHELVADTEEFKDRTGLHSNVMLGTCFIDIENFQSSADSTWGLYYSGKHFNSVLQIIRQWCAEHRDRQPTGKSFNN